jgi:hypothetical protein
MITFFFWPLMITSIVSSLVGLLFNNFRFLLISAILILSMSLYFTFTPRFMFLSLFFPFFYLGSALLIRKEKRILAFIINLPIYLFISWLGYIVLNQ